MAERTRTNGNGKRIWRAVIIVIAAVIIFAAFVSRHKSAVTIRVDRVVRQDLVTSISTNGKVEPIQNFEAHAPLPTTVKKVYVHEGQHVRAGDLLMQLDDADARAQAAKAQADLKGAQADENAVRSGGTQEEVITTKADLVKAQADRDAAQRNYDALQKLEKTGAAAPSEVRDAANRLAAANESVKTLQQKQSDRYSQPEVGKVNAQVDQARASYAAAEDMLQHSNIRSTVNGTVYSLPVKQGEYVRQGDLLVQVANLDKVQVRAFVDEPELGKLAAGQPVTITWDALPGKTWTGQITQMPYTITNYGTRNVGQVLCAVQNADGKLLPNINVTVNVNIANRNNAVTVAREAIREDENGRFVYLVKDGHLDRQPVQAGIANNTRIQITEGLEPGDLVALNTLDASQTLRPSLEVRVPR